MSPLWIGRNQSVGIGREITRGTGVAPSYWLNLLSFSYRDNPQRVMSESSFGRITLGDIAPVVSTYAEGSMEVEMGDASFGTILYALLGTLSTTDNGDGSYQHDFSLQNDNQHDSLSITTTETIGQLIFERSMINSFEMDITPENIVTYTVDFLGKQSQDTSGHTASYTAEKKFLGRYLTFKLAADTGSLGAESNIKLKNLRLTIEKNAEVNNTLSTVQPSDIVNKQFNVTGQFTLDYEDRTYLDYIKDGTNRAMRISLVHPDTIPGGGTNQYTWTLDLSKVDIEGWDPSFDNDDIVTQTLTFNGLYDTTNENVINSCQLINATDSY